MTHALRLGSILLLAFHSAAADGPRQRKAWPFSANEAKQRQEKTAKALGVPVTLTNSIGMTLVLIPPGEFDMGSRPGEERREPDSQPVHRVRITRAFYLGETEVTQKQFALVMGMNPSQDRSDGKPVEQVGWPMAVEFCKKLSAKEGKRYRLPTEAQWEYACRAGADTFFHFGDDRQYQQLDHHAWHGRNSQAMLHPVKSKRPNTWGLFDMHGGVWEWCADWYAKDYYARGPAADPAGPPDGTVRVLRGGSFLAYPWNCFCGYRSFFSPEYRDRGMGLRVLCELKK